MVINIYGDAGRKGAFASDLRLSFDMREYDGIYALPYTDIERLSTISAVQTARGKADKLVVHTYLNVAANHNTTGALNRQIGYLVFFLTNLVKADRFEIKTYNETKVFWRIVGAFRVGVKRGEKKQLSCDYGKVADDNLADALTLARYVRQDGLDN